MANKVTIAKRNAVKKWWKVGYIPKFEISRKLARDMIASRLLRYTELGYKINREAFEKPLEKGMQVDLALSNSSTIKSKTSKDGK